jgi:O-antigen biosynthesis protein
MKVGIATSQFPGVTSGGGISAPTARLARQLAASGLDVEVLLTRCEKHLSRTAVRSWADAGVVVQQASNPVEDTYPWWLNDQRHLAKWAVDSTCDVVLAQEWHGLLSLAGLARSQGSPPLISWLHGGTLYDKFGQGESLSTRWEVINSELERIQTESSDALVAPSEFLFGWYLKRGWRLGATRFHRIPYHLPDLFEQTQEARQVAALPERLLVFVGQLSMRKGIDRFLDAVKDATTAYADFGVAVFGRPVDVSLAEVEARLAGYGIPHVVRDDLDSQELWSVLRPHRCVLFVPSRLDNSPGVVLESLTEGHTALIWPSQNGALELAEDFPDHVLGWDPTCDLNELWASSPGRVDGDAWNRSTTAAWLDVLQSAIDRGTGGDSPPRPRPSVTVVIPTHNRVEMLCAAVTSVRGQTLAPESIVVVDDASTDDIENELQQRGMLGDDLVVLRNDESVGPAASRNAGLSRVTTCWVAFCDDDNVLRQDHLERLMREAEWSEADVVTSSLLGSQSPTRVRSRGGADACIDIMMLGQAGMPFAMGENVMGDSHLLARTDALRKIGGFPDSWPSSQEDWDLMIRLAVSSLTLRSCVEPTVYYRINTEGVQSTRAAPESSYRLAMALESSGLRLGGLGLLLQAELAESPMRRAMSPANVIGELRGVVSRREWVRLRRGMRLAWRELRGRGAK